jgi:phosphoserine phosphatase
MRATRLFVADVDSTLTSTEGIDLLAELAGSGETVAAITDRAMRGELEFEPALRQRVATLAGLPAYIVKWASQRVELNPGAFELVDILHEAGWAVGAVSGGFAEMVGPLAEELGLDFYRANTLGVRNGVLTGRVAGPIVGRATKAQTLKEWAASLGIGLERTVAMGDGANDLAMMAVAGMSIAYGGKPAVVAAADHAISGSLLRATPLLREFMRRTP